MKKLVLTTVLVILWAACPALAGPGKGKLLKVAEGLAVTGGLVETPFVDVSKYKTVALMGRVVSGGNVQLHSIIFASQASGDGPRTRVEPVKLSSSTPAIIQANKWGLQPAQIFPVHGPYLAVQVSLPQSSASAAIDIAVWATR